MIEHDQCIDLIVTIIIAPVSALIEPERLFLDCSVPVVTVKPKEEKPSQVSRTRDCL